jgi:hypothetical protein
MADGFVYHMLSPDDRLTLLRDRLRELEAEHFKVDLELRLADVVGQAEALNPTAQIMLATCEAKAAALRAWLDVNEPADA